MTKKAKIISQEPTIPSAASVDLGFLLWDVSRIWRIVLDRELKPLGVTRSQYSVISVLTRRDGMTQTALASDLDLTKVAVGGLLERMEASGLVERRDDESDARLRRVFLTRKGSRVGSRLHEVVDPIEAQVLQKVGDADVRTTQRSLELIKSALLDLGDDKSVPKIRKSSARAKNSRNL